MVNGPEQRNPDLTYNQQGGKWNNLDKACQYPDGTHTLARYINKKECYVNQHSGGSYTEHIGGKDPESGQALAGTMVTHVAENHVYSVKTGQMSTLHNGNQDHKAYGHGRDNYQHDGMDTTAKNHGEHQGLHYTWIVPGNLKIMAGGDVHLSTRKGSISMNAARDVEMKATEGRVMTNSKGGVSYSYSEKGSQGSGGDGHTESDGKVVENSKDNNEMSTEKQWIATSKEMMSHTSQDKIEHESSKDMNHYSHADISHAVGGTQYIGQSSKGAKSGCDVLTVCGPAKKVKAEA